MNRSTFETAYGFRRDEVHLGNWREAPWNAWGFSHAHELVPSTIISVGNQAGEDPDIDATDLLRQRLVLEYPGSTVADLLRQTSTDSLVVMKSGRFIADYHAAHRNAGSSHLLFSITKSLTAILAGLAEADGWLDPDEKVICYIPELENSAYGEARIRHLLDMRVSVAINESYQDRSGAFARYRRAMLWNSSSGKTETLLEVLAALRKGAGDHGGPFLYRSPNSVVLAIAIERSTGLRYAEMMRERIWKPIGARHNAYLTVDAIGTPQGAGGASVTARDLARIGELMRGYGNANGHQVLSRNWVRDTLSEGSAAAWREGDCISDLPLGRYRNQWYQTGFPNGAFLGIGIHGQWLYVNPAREVVIVKFSSQANPVDADTDAINLRLFEGIASVC